MNRCLPPVWIYSPEWGVRHPPSTPQADTRGPLLRFACETDQISRVFRRSRYSKRS